MADGTTAADGHESLYVRALQLRGLREDKREADFVCSTEAIDSYGTILRQSWIFDRFDANPVVLWAHRASELPIGHATKYGVVDGKLQATVRFSTAEANPQAEYVWQSLLQRSVRGISVRFDPRTVTFEKIDGVEVVVFSDNVLEELSVCSLPSNPETLVKLRERAMAARQTPTETDRAAKRPPHDPEKAIPLVQESLQMLSGHDVRVKLGPKASIPMEGEHAKSLAERSPNLAADRGAPPNQPELDMATEADLKNEIASLSTQVRELKTEKEDAVGKLAVAERARQDAEKRAVDAETEAKALRAQNEHLVKERDAANTARDAAEALVIEHEVEALVGVKITAAEKPDFVELRRTNKPLFERIVKQRSDLDLTKQVIPSSKDDAPPPAVPTETSEARSVTDADEQAEWEALQKRAIG